MAWVQVKQRFSTLNSGDTDDTKFLEEEDRGIQRTQDEPEILKFGFNSNCTKQILDNGGIEMLDEIYKENQIPKD